MIEASRPAEAADLPVVAALAAQARAEIADARGGAMAMRRELAPSPHPDDLAILVDRDDAMVLVGLIDDVIVGYAIETIERQRDDYLLAFIAEIFVLEGARGVGVGEAMLVQAFDFGRAHRCDAIESHVLPGNRHGKNFFERAAMVTRLLRVHTALPPAEQTGA